MVIILVTNYKQTAFQVEVKVDKSLNTSVHVSFQNPVKTPVKVLKGIIWEIYECASEVLSHFGEDVWCDFSAQWAQKVGGNSLCNIFSYCFHLQPVAVS